MTLRTSITLCFFFVPIPVWFSQEPIKGGGRYSIDILYGRFCEPFRPWFDDDGCDHDSDVLGTDLDGRDLFCIPLPVRAFKRRGIRIDTKRVTRKPPLCFVGFITGLPPFWRAARICSFRFLVSIEVLMCSQLIYSIPRKKGNHLSRSYSDTNLVQESCPFQNFQGWSMRQWLNQEELWKQDLLASDVFFGTRFMRAPNKEAPFFTTWRICLWYFDINTNTRCHCFRYFFLFVSVSALYVTQLSIIMKHIQIKNN